MRIASVASAFPPNRTAQSSITATLEQLWRDEPAAQRRLRTIHANCGVEFRDLALPLARYTEMRTFGEFNTAWIEVALDIGERAVVLALERAGLTPRDVDVILFSTVTGLAAPSIDARLVNRLGFRTDVRRMPLFGLGCVAGAAGVARAADLVRGDPHGVVLLLNVELCSLNLQRDDASLAHMISSGLFGDGACCAVITGAQHPARGTRIDATRSIFYPDTEEMMGWRISERGFQIVLSPEVPVLARERLGPDVHAFLATHGLTHRDIDFWVCHPGGPKVLGAARDGLGLTDEHLALSWECLREHGNLSSASVLLILEKTLRERTPRPGARGVMLAMGPGFCAELLLLTA